MYPMATSRMNPNRLGPLGTSLPPPSGRHLGQTDMRDLLPKLAEETELQKMLADEKMRAEQHRTNYQTIKAEHTRLQDEYIVLQTELRSTIEESKLVQEKYKSILEQLRRELGDKQRENDELRAQAMNPQKLEMLRLQLTEEVERPFKGKYQHLDEEVEKYRSEYNKLKYEYSFLKAEYEHDRVESQRIIEEMRMRHEAEVQNLRQERETVISRQQTDGTTDSQRVRVFQRENAQLQLKIKGILTEMEEVRAQKEHSGLQTENVTRLQNKQLVENTASIKALETERESLKLQCSSLQKELINANELHTRFTSRTHDLEKENIQLKNKSEEVVHKSKVELTNLKMEMLKQRGELERERDRLRNSIEDIKSQLEISKHSLDQQSDALVDKEREAVKRVQAAREEEWTKLHSVENEKMELETKLQELERRKIDEESQRHTDREKVEERIRQVTDTKQDAEKELLVVKTKLQHQQALLESLERERSENSDLKTRLHRIESAYNSYVGSERELVDNNSRLKQQVHDLHSDLTKTRDTLRNSKDDNDKILAQSRATWMEEKTNFQRRVDDLDSQMSDLHNQLSVVVTTHRKKKKKYTNLITKLKHKVTLCQAKMEQLVIEKEALKKSVPTETHFQMKKQLKQLMQRHRDYRALMLSAGLKEINIGNLSFASATGVPLDTAQPNFEAFDVVGKQHQKDLELLKERLDMLDDQQQYQLQELKGISPIGSPRLDDIEPPQLHQELSPERDALEA